jgi:hypothetical protein
LIADVNRATVFSKLDLKYGYHQVGMAEESRHVTTFRAQSGLYRYKCLIQGNTVMPEIYHNTIETKVVLGLEGVRSIFNDMFVYGKNMVGIKVHFYLDSVT